MDQSNSFLRSPTTLNQGFWDGAEEIQSSPLQNVQENLLAGSPESIGNDFTLPANIQLGDGLLDDFDYHFGGIEDYQMLDFCVDSVKSSPNREPNFYFDNTNVLSTIDDFLIKDTVSPTLSFQDVQNQSVTIKTKTVKTSNFRPKSIVKSSPSPYKITVGDVKFEEPSPVKITIDEFNIEPKLIENKFEIEQPKLFENKFEIEQPKLIENKFEIEQPKLIDNINNDILLSKMLNSSGNVFLEKLLDCDSDSDISIGYSPNSSPSHSPIKNLPVQQETQSIGPIRKKRTKAARSEEYSPMEKLEKKKEQNKSAAQRYRQKKKKEESDLTSTVEDLEKDNRQLKKRYKQMKLEVRSARKFLREAFILKGYCLTTGHLLTNTT